MKTNTEKKALRKQILNGSLSFLKGVAGGVNPILGAAVGMAEGVVKGVQKEKAANLDGEIGGAGKIDYPRLAGVVVFAGLALAVVTGHLSIEQVKDLIKIFMGVM